MPNIDVEESLCERRSLDSASTVWLGQRNRDSIDSHPLHGAEQRRRQHGAVGPKYLICLTLGTGGLQVVWTTIMGQGSPYLSYLGLPPLAGSFIWLSGPLSGLIVQPYVSILSDQCSHPWGQRKPFIFYGTIITILCLLFLPWTEELSSHILCSFGYENNSQAALILKGIIAGSLILILNVAIQPVQMGLRALIVEACPPQQQAQATAYASCITGIGSILGYGSGFVDLPNLLPWFGNTQLKCLCVLASLALSVAVAITLHTIKDQTIVLDNESIRTKANIWGVYRKIRRCIKLMPKDMTRVFKVQFFAWMGWFPFLFYITSYIAGLYERDILAHSADMDSISTSVKTHPHSDAVRHGNLAMVYFAIVALLSNILLPLIVVSEKRKARMAAFGLSNLSDKVPVNEERKDVLKARLKDYTSGPLRFSLFARTKVRLPSSWVTLPRAWMVSHILTSTILFCTSLTRSPVASTCLVSLLGVSWAVTQWVPLALISAAITTQQSYRMMPERNHSLIERPGATDTDYQRSYQADEEEEDVEEGGLVETGGLRAGAVMGVYNIAIAAPQIVAALGSSGIFWGLGRWELENNEIVGWAIRAWGFTGFIAAWLAAGIENKPGDDGDDDDYRE